MANICENMRLSVSVPRVFVTRFLCDYPHVDISILKVRHNSQILEEHTHVQCEMSAGDFPH